MESQEKVQVPASTAENSGVLHATELTHRPFFGREEVGRVAASSGGGGDELGRVFALKMEVCCGQAEGK